MDITLFKSFTVRRVHPLFVDQLIPLWRNRPEQVSPAHMCFLQVLEDPLWNTLPRDLDIVELWSGTATICRAGERKGYRAHPFDKIRSDEEDLTSKWLDQVRMSAMCVSAVSH